MPTYIYKHPEEEIYVEVAQKMNDKHVYFDESGLQWNRVFLSPQTSIDTKVNPFSGADFLKKSSNIKTYGEAIDLSKEMSDKRREIVGGIDPIRQKAEKKFYNLQ